VNVIHKHELNGDTLQTVSLPISSTILSVVEQYQNIVMYVIVDVEQYNNREIEFLLLGTGQIFNYVFDDYSFLDTVKLSGGSLMFHVFVEKMEMEIDIND